MPRSYRRKPITPPRVDLSESLAAGLSLLKRARAPFALAGKLAVWEYVSPEAQTLTKDVDFAVPHGYAEQVGALAKDAGYRVMELDIGGYGVRGAHVVVDFIDRHPEYTLLFSEAVKAARLQPKRRFRRSAVPIVPRDYLIAMKLVTLEPKDNRDVEELLLRVAARQYPALRDLVRKHLGPLGAARLDLFARRVGHPGPGVKKRYKA